MRRDLEALERDGIFRRVHGGAARARPTAAETAYAMRAFGHTDEKARIGARRTELLAEGQTVILDGGTRPWKWHPFCESGASRSCR